MPFGAILDDGEYPDCATIYGPAAVGVVAEIMRNGVTEPSRLGAAREVLDRAYERPAVCTENNNDDILFANLFENGHDAADEAGTT